MIVSFLVFPCKNLDSVYRYYVIIFFIKIALGFLRMALRFYKDYKQCLYVFSLFLHSSYMSCLQFRFKYYKQCILDGFRLRFISIHYS